MNRNKFLIAGLKIEESTTRLEEDLQHVYDLRVYEEETYLSYEDWVKNKLHRLLGGYIFAEDVESIERMRERVAERYGEIDGSLVRSGMDLVAENLPVQIQQWKNLGEIIRRESDKS